MERNGHAIIPSSSLVPENDPTTLFTGSGMQPMLPYLLGEEHPKGLRITDSQKCFRAEDIEEVGDNRHTTFFEMLGNWSFGDYFREQQIEFIFEFLTSEIGIDPKNLYITVFGGDTENNLMRDEESPVVWKKLFKKVGIDAEVAEIGSESDGYARGMKSDERIFYYDASKNWWSRAGVPSNMPNGEPGGPDSEMFYDFGTPHDVQFGEHCHPNCDCGRFMEIGNNVFMQYVKKGESNFIELQNKNIDFGGGLERITAAVLNEPDVFKIDLLQNIILHIEKLSEKKYEDNQTAFRVIADHIRGAVFMISDRVSPQNTEQGYFVRRLLRRAVRYADKIGMPAGELGNLAKSVITTYETHYTTLTAQKNEIISVICNEEKQFRKTLQKGLREFEKRAVHGLITGEDAFILFTTYGFPYELSAELAEERDVRIDRDTFLIEMKKHQELSRSGSEQKFKGGLQDDGEKTVQYHTATHLLLAGLKHELGEGVHQAGSNITNERLRFDFTHSKKVERDVLDRVEAFVNNVIQKNGLVVSEVMTKKTAQTDASIEGSFWDRYPDEVKVYTITDNEGVVYSRELCGGPHVKNMLEIKGIFKIIKEESSASGVRRIKATLTEGVD